MNGAQPAPLAFSTVFGILMAAACFVDADRPGLIAVALAVVAVLVGTVVPAAAVVAVLLTVVAIVLSDPPVLFAALSGLSAAAYLVVRYAVKAGVVTTTWPTVIGAIGFTVVGVVATSVPLHLAWLPVLAPPAALAIVALATRPFFGLRRVEPTK
jgi:hypothetical protein